MAICKFYLQDRCAFGNSCKFEHPADKRAAANITASSTSAFGTGNSAFGSGSAASSPSLVSRFGTAGTTSAFGGGQRTSAFGSGSIPSSSSAFGSTSAFGAPAPPTAPSSSSQAAHRLPSHVSPGQVNLSQQTIDEDLRLNRPLWPPSVFGPAKYEPNLIAGCDVSQDELRVEALLAMAVGGTATQDYIAKEAQMFQRGNAAVQDVLRDKAAALRRAEANQAQALAAINNNKKKSGTAVAALGVGQSSAFGATSPFNKPSGNTGQIPAFGSPSAFGQPSAFGASSTINNNSSSAFGQSSAFGTTAAPSAGGSAFGTPSKPAASSLGFSSFGSNPASSSTAFGQTTTTTTTAPSAFGQTTTGPTTSAFGQVVPPTTTSFGQTTSVFGQPNSVFATNPPTSSSSSSAFTANTFGQPSKPNPFAATQNHTLTTGIGFATGSQPSQISSSSSSVFGSNPQSTSSTSPFGSSFPTTVPTTTTNSSSSTLTSTTKDPYAHFAPKEEEVPEEIKKAFLAEEFQWASVPGIEPPLSVR